MPFYSRNNRPETIPVPQSKKLIPTFSLEINKTTGKKELKETGKTNIYDMIQASKESTMIYNILDRFQAGDVEVLNKVQGAYGDFTNVPRTLAEAQQQLIDAENLFMSLPLEMRKEFNHSTSEFLAAAANGDLEPRLAKLGRKTKKVEDTKTLPAQPQTPIQQVPQTPGMQEPNKGVLINE